MTDDRLQLSKVRARQKQLTPDLQVAAAQAFTAAKEAYKFAANSYSMSAMIAAQHVLQLIQAEAAEKTWRTVRGHADDQQRARDEDVGYGNDDAGSSAAAEGGGSEGASSTGAGDAQD